VTSSHINLKSSQVIKVKSGHFQVIKVLKSSPNFGKPRDSKLHIQAVCVATAISHTDDSDNDVNITVDVNDKSNDFCIM